MIIARLKFINLCGYTCPSVRMMSHVSLDKSMELGGLGGHSGDEVHGIGHRVWRSTSLPEHVAWSIGRAQVVSN